MELHPIAVLKAARNVASVARAVVFAPPRAVVVQDLEKTPIDPDPATGGAKETSTLSGSEKFFDAAWNARAHTKSPGVC